MPVSREEALALQSGEAALYHILADGTAQEVEGVTVAIDGESATMTFTSDSFSPYIVAKKAEEATETCITVTKNADASTCTVKYTVISSDFDKSPVICIAFYNDKNMLTTLTIKKDGIVSDDEFEVLIPSDSSKCKVMLWTSKLVPLCTTDDCQFE